MFQLLANCTALILIPVDHSCRRAFVLRNVERPPLSRPGCPLSWHPESSKFAGKSITVTAAGIGHLVYPGRIRQRVRSIPSGNGPALLRRRSAVILFAHSTCAISHVDFSLLPAQSPPQSSPDRWSTLKISYPAGMQGTHFRVRCRIYVLGSARFSIFVGGNRWSIRIKSRARYAICPSIDSGSSFEFIHTH